MTQNTPEDTVKEGITEADRANIEMLIAACNQHDGLEFPISIEEMFTKPDNGLLYYQHEALIGIAYLPGKGNVEMSGVIHPEHRRKGVGRCLLEKSKRVCQQRSTKKLLLICFDKIAGSTLFAEAVGGKYTQSEYTLAFDRTANRSSSFTLHDGLQLRQVQHTEADLVSNLIAAAFGDDKEETRNWIKEDIQVSGTRLFFIMLHNEFIGAIRLLETHPDHIYITTFGILPQYRRRGYGRQILMQIVDTLQVERWQEILLDVETENRNALVLYESCGFRQIRVEHYYDIAL